MLILEMKTLRHKQDVFRFICKGSYKASIETKFPILSPLRKVQSCFKISLEEPKILCSILAIILASN